MNKAQILINKPVYLRLLILEISKIVMNEFRSDYERPKYGGKANLCYTDTDRFIDYMKTEEIYADIWKDAETRFDTSNY